MMASPRKVLILDADLKRADELSARLRYLDYEPILPTGSAPALERGDSIAVVVGSTSGSVDSTLETLRREHPELPFLCLPGDGNSDSGSEGINWPLELPLKRSQLTRLLKRAERYRGVERRHRLTGSSACIRRVRQLIEQVADFDTSVLVTGPSGTGKELVARTIHELSDRADKPFVPINCGAIPADLLESELFGHRKGAFTGAIADRTGRFELAEGGTLFLDEIGEMSLDMQVKLLRVLQERAFERVGSNKTRPCDVRIIAATHCDLPAAVESGDFRQDLFYRLNVFPIEMPPLKKRLSDIPALLEELLIQHVGDGTVNLRISPDAMRVLATYSWPGNVRELGNLVERLAIVKPEGVIDVADLPPKYRDASPAGAEPNPVAEVMQLGEQNLKDYLQSLEKDLIQQAFTTSKGVVAQAAKLLNMRRTTLVEKIKKLDLH